MPDAVEHDAHHRAQHRAHYAEQHELYKQQGVHGLRNTSDGKRRGLPAQPKRELMRDHRRQHARKQRRVVHHAHADDLHCKHARRERRAEQGCKARRHAAHGDRARVAVVQPHPVADVARDRTAELQGRALAAGRAAHRCVSTEVTKMLGASRSRTGWFSRTEVRIKLVPRSSGISAFLYQNAMKTPTTGSKYSSQSCVSRFSPAIRAHGGTPRRPRRPLRR